MPDPITRKVDEDVFEAWLKKCRERDRVKASRRWKTLGVLVLVLAVAAGLYLLRP